MCVCSVDGSEWKPDQGFSCARLLSISSVSFGGKLLSMLLFLVLLLKPTDHTPPHTSQARRTQTSQTGHRHQHIYESTGQHRQAVTPHQQNVLSSSAQPETPRTSRSDMSPSCGSMSLLVLLGAALVFGNPLQSQKSIADLLGLEAVEVGSKPLFTSVIRSNTTCQSKEDVQLLNATLDVYMHIFSSLLQHGHQQGPALLDQLSGSDREQVRSYLKEQQHKMRALRAKLVRRNQDNEDVIRQLSKIKVDSPLDQRKALAEFDLVYKLVHRLSSSDQ